jgi:hypothetical protein
MVATPESLASGELTPGDPEFESIAARCSIGKAAASDFGGGLHADGGGVRGEARWGGGGGGASEAGWPRSTSPSSAACARWPIRTRPRTRTQQGSLQRGGPGGPTPDTWARSGQLMDPAQQHA